MTLTKEADMGGRHRKAVGASGEGEVPEGELPGPPWPGMAGLVPATPKDPWAQWSRTRL